MTAPWILQLRAGSFRGAPFEIDSHDYEGGRRIANHVFPYKDLAYTEDLGKKQRQFTINAYIIGQNYFGARKKLIEALETEGPGILVHPYLNGNKNVVVDEFKLTETTSDGGIVKFSITFKETGTKPEPVGVTDLKANVADYADALEDSASSDFLSFNVLSTASFVFASATAMIGQASDLMAKTTSGLPGDPEALSNLAYSIRNLKGNSADLARRPGALSASIISSMKLLTSVLNIDGLLPENSKGIAIVRPDQALLDAKQGQQKRGAFTGLLDFYKGLPPTLDTTQSRKTEKNNQELMNRMFTLAALSELSRVSTETSYGSTDEAIAQRDLLISTLDDFLFSGSISDETYGAIQDLQAAIQKAIPDPDGETPRLSLVPLSQTTPTLPVVYDLYESLDLENDVILRNHIQHPGFISPAKPLEVIAGD